MFFSKKEEEMEEEEIDDSEDEVNEKSETSRVYSGEMSLGQVSAKLEKLEAQFSSFYELQRVASERFSRINEQMGELRSMLIDRDKSMQRLEANATKAIDLVDSVEPEKLMVEIRKEDSKIEALKINLESNENIMNNTITELKDMRNQMSVFKGLDQVIKLNEEVKDELMTIRKAKATTERHAERVDTIFSEMQKRFSDMQKFGDRARDLDKSFKQLSSDLDSMNIKMDAMSSKRDFEGLITKMEEFEKHTNNIILLMKKKSEKFESDLNELFNEKAKQVEKLIKGYEMMASKNPDIDKYFNLLGDSNKNSQLKIEKIKEIGVEEKEEPEEDENEDEEKKSAFSRIKEKILKKKAEE